MKKPTCETCVYWDVSTEVKGVCRRHSPRHLIATYSDGQTPNLEEMTDFAVTNKNEFCGDHPDFPKYIEHWKQERTTEDE